MTTFADIIALGASERFMLVRLTPARCIDGDLTGDGHGNYVMLNGWNRPIARIERNGTPLTPVDLLSGNDQYVYDEGTGSLVLQLAAAPDDTTNVIVLFYYLFFTSGLALNANEDPLDISTALRQWEPRIVTEPDMSQTVENLVAGVFTIADTSVEIANSDNFIGQFLGENDSFNEKDADVWLGVRSGPSSAPAFERVYKGSIKTITVTDEMATIEFYDVFSRLSQPALMGDTPNEAYYQATSGSYRNVSPTDAGKPVPFFIGRWSRYETQNDPQLSGLGGHVFTSLDPSKMPEAVCTSFDEAVSTSTNRAWTLGRIPGEGFRSWTLPAFTGTPTGGGGTTVPTYISFDVDATALAAADVAVGDRVKLTESGVGTHAARVCLVDTSAGVVSFVFNSQTSYSYTSAATVQTFDDPQLVLVDENGAQYHLTPSVDYNTNVSLTSGGNLLVEVDFVDDFEAGLVPSNGFPATFAGPLDPTRHRIFFRLRLAASNYAKHGDVLSNMMTIAGLTVKPSTFTAANTALPINCAFQIPQYDEADYGTYLDYAKLILSSTLGFVALDSLAEVQYRLVAAPSATDDTSDNVVLSGTFQIVVDYSDVVTGLIAYNPHNASRAAIEASPSPSETRYNVKAQYLHGIQNATQFRHVLETITDRIDTLLAVHSNRRATFSFQTATRYLDAKIGDDAQLTTSFLLGGDTARAVKIVALDKSADKFTGEAIDLLGVT